MQKCPYNLRIEQVNQEIHEYNEAGQEVFRQHMFIEQQIPTQCFGKECGAYRFGKCTYKR